MGDRQEPDGSPSGNPRDQHRMVYNEVLPPGISMDEYRKLHTKRRIERWAKVRRGEIPPPEIRSVQIEARSVDMRKLKGNSNEYVKEMVDQYYGPDHPLYQSVTFRSLSRSRLTVQALSFPR